ncbi:MAG: hypothetical protein SNH73_08185 [Rikenellaceae bacterium]
MTKFKIAAIAIACLFVCCSKSDPSTEESITGEWKVLKYEGYSETRYSNIYYSDSGSVTEVSETNSTEREEWSFNLENSSNIWVFENDKTLVIYGSDLSKSYSSYVVDNYSDKLLLYRAESQYFDTYDIVTSGSNTLIITKKTEQEWTGSQFDYEDLDNYDRGVVQSKTVVETEEIIEFAKNK